jgi:hypothetical protein
MLRAVSEASERPEPKVAPRRPGYLLFAWISMWVLGLGIMSGGYTALKQLYDPISQGLYGDEPAERAYLTVMQAHSSIETPLAVAELLLGGFLLFVATRLLLGARTSQSLALQALLANLVLVIGGYALRESFRADFIPAILEHASRRFERAPEIVERDLWLQFRVELGLRVVTLALATLSFRAPRAREYLNFRPEAPEP